MSTSYHHLREALSHPFRASLHTIAAAVLLLVLTAATVAWPLIEYDSWLYHLPISARLWGIGGVGSFNFSPFLEARWEGFPKAWLWIQGAFWAATGSLRSVAIPSVMVCLAYFVVVSRILRFPPSLLILAFFACPMLIMQYQSSYSDLPAAALLAIGFFLLASSYGSNDARLSWSVVLGAAVLGLAGNVKVQATIAVFLICPVLGFLCVRRSGFKAAVRNLWPIALAVGIASITCIDNFVRKENPFYPQQIAIGGRVVFGGPEDPTADALPPRYELGGRLFSMPQPLAFLMSASELDWTARGVSPRYNLDGNTGDQALNGLPSRTGGWGWLFVLINGALLVTQLARCRNEKDRLQRSLVASAAALVALTAFLPRSHELRYWLFLPLIVMPVNLRYALRNLGATSTSWVLITAASYALAQTTLSPNSGLIFNRPPLPDMRSFSKPPRKLTERLAVGGGYCDEDPLLFRYSPAVRGDVGRLSQRLDDCVANSGR